MKASSALPCSVLKRRPEGERRMRAFLAKEMQRRRSRSWRAEEETAVKRGGGGIALEFQGVLWVGLGGVWLVLALVEADGVEGEPVDCEERDEASAQYDEW